MFKPIAWGIAEDVDVRILALTRPGLLLWEFFTRSAGFQPRAATGRRDAVAPAISGFALPEVACRARQTVRRGCGTAAAPRRGLG